MLTVADAMLIVGTAEMLITCDVLMVTFEPAGEVSVIVTLSGCEPVIVPASGSVKVLVALAVMALVVPRIVRIPKVAEPLFTVSVILPVLPAPGRIGSKLKPLLIVNTPWLPAASVAEVSDAAAARLTLVAGGAAVNAGFGALVPLTGAQAAQSAPRVRLMAGGEPTVTLK